MQNSVAFRLSHSLKLTPLLLAATLVLGCKPKALEIDPATLGANVVLSAYGVYQEHQRMQDRSKWRLSDLDVGTVTVRYFSDDAFIHQIKEYIVENNDITIAEFIDKAIYEARNTRHYALGNHVYYGFHVTSRSHSQSQQILQILMEFHEEAVLAGKRLF